MLNILVVCTGNSCRSVLGEALLNHWGQGRVKAFSAGSHPIGRVNPDALATLQRHGLVTEGYKSQSWHEFEQQTIDIVITVCDNAEGEVCPSYLHSTLRAHWGVNDPSHVQGSESELLSAFEETYGILENRVQKMLALPLESMPEPELNRALDSLGAQLC